MRRRNFLLSSLAVLFGFKRKSKMLADEPWTDPGELILAEEPPYVVWRSPDWDKRVDGELDKTVISNQVAETVEKTFIGTATDMTYKNTEQLKCQSNGAK